MYGIFAVIGALACVIVAYFLIRNAPRFELFVFGVFAAFGVSVGGHFLFGLVNFREILDILGGGEGDILNAFRGSVYYGGFLGALLAVWIYTKKSPVIPKNTVFDVFAVCAPLFHVFGRVGCYFAGCCYGVLMENGKRFPVQLVEAGGNILIFAVLLTFFNKNKFRGKLVEGYVLMYAPLRLVLEFLRGDEVRGIWLRLSTSQWISLVLLASVALRLFLQKDKN